MWWMQIQGDKRPSVFVFRSFWAIPIVPDLFFWSLAGSFPFSTLVFGPPGLPSRPVALGTSPAAYVGVADRVYAVGAPFSHHPPVSPAEVLPLSSWRPQYSFAQASTDLLSKWTGSASSCLPKLSLCCCWTLPEGAALKHRAMFWQSLKT